MRVRTMRRCCAVLAAVLVFGAVRCAVAETLGDVIRTNGWEGIIGTWVDQETQGEKLKLVYVWKFKDAVIEVMSSSKDTTSVNLIGRNAKTGEIYNMSADSKGGGSIGKWSFDGVDATLEATFVTSEGHQGAIKVLQHLQDENTMVITVAAQEPVVIRMVRFRERAKDPFAP